MTGASFAAHPDTITIRSPDGDDDNTTVHDMDEDTVEAARRPSNAEQTVTFHPSGRAAASAALLSTTRSSAPVPAAADMTETVTFAPRPKRSAATAAAAATTTTAAVATTGTAIAAAAPSPVHAPAPAPPATATTQSTATPSPAAPTTTSTPAAVHTPTTTPVVAASRPSGSDAGHSSASGMVSFASRPRPAAKKSSLGPALRVPMSASGAGSSTVQRSGTLSPVKEVDGDTGTGNHSHHSTEMNLPPSPDGPKRDVPTTGTTTRRAADAVSSTAASDAAHRPAPAVDPKQFKDILSWQPRQLPAKATSSSTASATSASASATVATTQASVVGGTTPLKASDSLTTPNPKSSRPPTAPATAAAPPPASTTAADSPAEPTVQWNTPGVGGHKNTPQSSASSAAASSPLAPSFVVNGKPYRKLEAIGKGGSSKVYKVSHT